MNSRFSLQSDPTDSWRLTATLDKSVLVLLGNVLDRDSIFQSTPAASMIRCGRRKRLSFCSVFRKSGAITQACRGHAWKVHGSTSLEMNCSYHFKVQTTSKVHFTCRCDYFIFFRNWKLGADGLGQISWTCHFITLHLWFGLEMQSLSYYPFLTPVTPAYSTKMRLWSKTPHWQKHGASL